MTARAIQLRGVEVHNLRHVDLDIPHRKLVVFCGVSGSGKSSLALDTLYAEGQRRYIESFSAYTRQFLERLEKPAAERIDGIPPAVAVTRQNNTRGNRATVATAAEIADYLRLLFAKVGQTFCPGCGQEIRRDSPQTVAGQLQELPEGSRFMLAFPRTVASDESLEETVAGLREEGFVRIVWDGRTRNLSTDSLAEPESAGKGDAQRTLYVVLDRLAAGKVADQRLRDSVETAMNRGGGRIVVFVEAAGDSVVTEAPVSADTHEIDDRPWRMLRFSNRRRCESCELDLPEPDPRLFSFNSPLGACPTCEGFGNVVDMDMNLIVPDRTKSLAGGAIAPWTTPAYSHELDELLALAPDYKIPVDVPFSELSDEQVRLIREGVPERDFGGLQGFMAWLERRKYKMHLRVFLSRWRSYRLCPVCDGARLKPAALATRVGDRNIADVCRMKVATAREWLESLSLTDDQRAIGRVMIEQVGARLRYLQSVGLDYLTLDRTLRTLSGGEAQRVSLTTALGSSLVQMLYVLDEPSVGLHPSDVSRLVSVVERLRDRGNTVVVVEHEEAFIRSADRLIEIGPGAGQNGGRVVYEGLPDGITTAEGSVTGDFLAGRRGVALPASRRRPDHGWLRLSGARGNNLQNVTVEFPLGVLCLVTGVSGAGKSTLIQDTLYPAICQRKRQDAEAPAPFDEIVGDGQIDEVVMIDQSPIGRSPRSNPVTYIKAFDPIRAVFADTLEARTHNYKPSHFSFNVDGGRCNVCQGDGYIEIDMQFLADVYMKCGQCGGRRYRKEILDVKYRGLSIADVLEMTVREAFSFFRGQPKVQARLKRLLDVGLDYLRLGQPANTLSAGEAQRLKLAAYLSDAKRNRTLFILDEPTTGLHFADVVQLLDCFDALLNVGHSLIVVEHNVQLMRAADYIVDLGPGAAEAGGQVVVQGTPEHIARCKESVTGKYLRDVLSD
ncbi:MAG: excinuclease ABC subunit UvrA [Pirellulaceae bacterium]